MAWKFPPWMTSLRSGNSSGLSVVALISRSITARVCSSSSHTMPCTCAAQRIGILHPPAIHMAARYIRLAADPARNFASAGNSPLLPLLAQQDFIGDMVRGAQRLDAHGGGKVGGGKQLLGLLPQRHRERRRKLRAIDEAQALLGAE